MLSDKIRQRRNEKKLSQEKLAELLKVTRQAVSRWETGEDYPQCQTLCAISVELDISLDELFDEELNYLRKGKNGDDTSIKQYPGLISGLQVFADALKKTSSKEDNK